MSFADFEITLFCFGAEEDISAVKAAIEKRQTGMPSGKKTSWLPFCKKGLSLNAVECGKHLAVFRVDFHGITAQEPSFAFKDFAKKFKNISFIATAYGETSIGNSLYAVPLVYFAAQNGKIFEYNFYPHNLHVPESNVENADIYKRSILNEYFNELFADFIESTVIPKIGKRNLFKEKILWKQIISFSKEFEAPDFVNCIFRFIPNLTPEFLQDKECTGLLPVADDRLYADPMAVHIGNVTEGALVIQLATEQL